MSTAVAVVSAAVLSFTVLGGNTAMSGEVFLQAAPEVGPDPFTPSTATRAESVAKVTPMTAGMNAKDGTNTNATTSTASATNGARTLEVDGGYPGLYGGTRNVASCDVEKQIRFLTQHPDKGRAFAVSLGIRQPEIPSYLRSLTPVRLGWDTRVTNHGYRNGAPTSYQAVLQAGTPVLVDGRGVPRVRCACGNPLDPPVAVRGGQTYSGAKWSSFRSSGLVAVRPAAKPVKTVTVFDQDRRGWYERPSGAAESKHDREVPPPKGQTPGSAYPVLPAAHPGSVQPLPDRPPNQPPKTNPNENPNQNPDQNPGNAPARIPGNLPGEGSEKATDQDPGKEPGQKTGEHPGKESGREPGKAPAPDADEERDQDPGKAPEKEPGKDSGTVPDKGSGQHSGEDSGKKPGKESGEDPGKAPEKEPGKDSGTVPDKGSGQHPGEDSGKKPGKESGEDPGKAPEKEPGKDSGTVP
ncbi:DUF6777 domain-containing protein, partial [Streptomyces sp. NPDC091682]|uniref:DUF6777 domain-containing protein n=1 Tax=Streptomyces sp. NPDC091682 TaxID=3366005 RepID=UPI0037F3B586